MPGGRCIGRAIGVAPEREAEVTAYLDARELLDVYVYERVTAAAALLDSALRGRGLVLRRPARARALCRRPRPSRALDASVRVTAWPAPAPTMSATRWRICAPWASASPELERIVAELEPLTCQRFRQRAPGRRRAARHAASGRHPARSRRPAAGTAGAAPLDRGVDIVRARSPQAPGRAGKAPLRQMLRKSDQLRHRPQKYGKVGLPGKPRRRGCRGSASGKRASPGRELRLRVRRRRRRAAAPVTGRRPAWRGRSARRNGSWAGRLPDRANSFQQPDLAAPLHV